jgi:hypothetical protein
MPLRHALLRTALMMIVLAVLLPALNLAFGGEGFPWLSVIGMPAVALVLDLTVGAVSFVRDGNGGAGDDGAGEGGGAEG